MNHHKINYVEFGAQDLAAVKAFYSEVFGWEFTDYGPTYTAFSNSGLEGGFTTETPPNNGALVVLYSNALETTKSAIEQHGGSITKDIFAFPGGKRFHFTDPSGNELAVWSEA